MAPKPIAYVGAGMSTAPQEILDLMEDAAQALAAEGLHLRAGCGLGPTEVFIREARKYGTCSIFIPALTFGNLSVDQPGVYGPFTEGFADIQHATNYARKFHPSWPGLAGSVQMLMTAVSYQFLGPQLDDPPRFVLCWTPDGIGGDTTGQIIRLAQAFNITIFDLGVMDPNDAATQIWDLLAQPASNNQNERA